MLDYLIMYLPLSIFWAQNTKATHLLHKYFLIPNYFGIKDQKFKKNNANNVVKKIYSIFINYIDVVEWIEATVWISDFAKLGENGRCSTYIVVCTYGNGNFSINFTPITPLQYVIDNKYVKKSYMR